MDGSALQVLMHWKMARAQREAALKNSKRTSFRVAEYQRKLDEQQVM